MKKPKCDKCKKEIKDCSLRIVEKIKWVYMCNKCFEKEKPIGKPLTKKEWEKEAKELVENHFFGTGEYCVESGEGSLKDVCIDGWFNLEELINKISLQIQQAEKRGYEKGFNSGIECEQDGKAEDFEIEQEIRQQTIKEIAGKINKWIDKWEKDIPLQAEDELIQLTNKK